MSLDDHTTDVEASAPSCEPEPIPCPGCVELERRASAAETELVRLRGQFSKAYNASVAASRVFDEAVRWWR